VEEASVRTAVYEALVGLVCGEQLELDLTRQEGRCLDVFFLVLRMQVKNLG